MIRVYNALTGKKEEFVPLSEGKVGIYVCGVTPYAKTHIGHARPSVVWDVIKKFLRYKGYEVTHVQNFTDVDDKIIDRAQKEGIDPLVLSREYAQAYLASMDALGVERATEYPLVSEHMKEILDLVQTLVDKGHAYVVNGNVFFSVVSFPGYGKLSNQKVEELLSGTRFEVDKDKQSPLDFALWKRAKEGEISWDSPFGKGRPGWHIECSAMSKSYLGETFDFHGGGSDLVFPHHENEIAQSEAATGKPLAQYWVHSGMLNLTSEKMSKSLGNVISIDEVLAKYPKELFRFYMLSTQYRSELEYYDGKLDDLMKGFRRMNDCVSRLERLAFSGEEVQEGELRDFLEDARARFFLALEDDFNTALAIGVLFEAVSKVNAFVASVEEDEGYATSYALALRFFKELGGDLLGILQSKEETKEGLVEPLMELILELRKTLREEKNYTLADFLREKLQGLGIVLEDTPKGTRWKVE